MVKNRALSSGATALNFGEVIGFSTSISDIFYKWQQSPKHNEVLLNKNYNWVGIGVKKIGQSYVSVLNFSSGNIGSTTISYLKERIILEGEFINKPSFKGDFIIINYSISNNEFTLEIKPLKNNFFIYVYDKNNNLTDRVDIFLNNY